MKCKDFEFEYIAAPEEIAGDACEHLQGCTNCQAFIEEQMGFEQQLAAVIKGDVPEDFRHTVREYVVNNRPSFWNLPKVFLALAASLIMAVGVVGVNFNFQQTNQLPIDQLVFQHFEHDGVQSMKASHQVSLQQLAQFGEQFGVRVKLAEDISFAEKCPIGDTYGLHMVYQYNGQPITVIYMPDVRPEATIPFHYAGLKGWIKPLEKGSMAVLGGSTIDLPEEEAFAQQAIEWL